jgi:hypothetical protein
MITTMGVSYVQTRHPSDHAIQAIILQIYFIYRFLLMQSTIVHLAPFTIESIHEFKIHLYTLEPWNSENLFDLDLIIPKHISYHNIRVSVRLLFNAKWILIFQLYHGDNKLNSMRWRWCPICTRPRSWSFIVLAHWNNITRVDMLLHSDTLSIFRAS